MLLRETGHYFSLSLETLAMCLYKLRYVEEGGFFSWCVLITMPFDNIEVSDIKLPAR